MCCFDVRIVYCMGEPKIDDISVKVESESVAQAIEVARTLVSEQVKEDARKIDGIRVVAIKGLVDE